MNIKLLFLLISILFSCRGEKQLSKYPNYIGDIDFDPKLDNPNFKLCINNDSFQYFNDSKGFQYKGEKIALEKAFYNNYINQNLLGETGLIRIRFIVNCEGQTGRFRILQMDENYKSKNFNKKISTQLLKISKNLKGWNVKQIDNQNIDYYQYLIFKIKDGNLIDILP